jgi:uncharacterized membrane protein
MRNASENREFARESIRGFGVLAIGACAIVTLITAAISASSNIHMFFYFVAAATSLFVVSPLSYGLVLFFMNLTRRNNPQISDVFKPFSTAYSASVLTSVLSALYTVLWSLLLIVPGIIKAYAYSMAPYLVMNDPNLKGNAAITKSRALMNGHKFRLFCLQLSFIGWLLLSVLTFGLLLIFYVGPYMAAAETAFFQEIAEQAGIAEPYAQNPDNPDSPYPQVRNDGTPDNPNRQ